MTRLRAASGGLLALAVLSAAPAASADELAAYWREARVKWNAVGDKAAAGDENAKQQLIDAVGACAPETDCFKNRGAPPDAERTRLQAAWEACAKPQRAGQYLPDRAVDLCRRNLNALTPAQIDAAAAAVNVGWLFGAGKLGERDDKRAFDHYFFAAEFQHPVGHYNVGRLIMDGKLGASDANEAATRFLKAGRLGVVDGWIALGDLRQEHGSERPFTDMFFAMSAVEGYTGSARYADSDFFYRRALAENPSDAQKKKIEGKIAALPGAAPKPAAAPASAAPPSAPAGPQLREANMAAARECIPFADEMQSAQRKLSGMDRRLDKAEEDLAAYDRYMPNVNYDPGSPAANAQAWNRDMRDAKAESFNRAVRERNDFAREVDDIVASYNARCTVVRLTKAEHEAACAGKLSNRFCKGFDFE